MSAAPAPAERRVATAPPVAEITDLLYAEAELIDEWRLDEWLALWHDDCRYWVPIDETRSPDESISIIYDDHLRMEERIYYLNEAGGASAYPRSRTMRTITNVRVTAEGEGWRVRSRQVIYELRLGHHGQIGLGETRVLPATCEHFIVQDGSGRLLIKEKTVLLLHRDQPHRNMMFIL